MRFEKGASVYTAEGDKVGEIERVVLDPETREVTHVIVEKGFLFTVDKVVPVSLVGVTTEDRVTLREDAGELEALPDFVKTDYVPVISQEAEISEGGAVYWYPPIGAQWGAAGGYGPQYGYPPIPPYVVKTERRIPEGTVALEEGARVISKGGEHVGDVEAVLTDPEADRVTHLVISKGFLLTEEKLIPTSWISTVMSDEIHLLVGASQVESLEDYEPS